MKYRLHESRISIFLEYIVLVALIFNGPLKGSTRTDNAALLHYQSFLALPKNTPTLNSINNCLSGNKPDEVVLSYLTESERVINLTLNATQSPVCSWGFMNRLESNNSFVDVIGNLRSVAIILELEARKSVDTQNVKYPLQLCLAMRDTVRHVENEGVLSYNMSLSVQWRAFLCMQHILSYSLDGSEVLTWLQSQLGSIQNNPSDPGCALENHMKDAFDIVREATKKSRQIECSSDDKEFEELKLAEEQYQKYINTVNSIISSGLSYKEKYADLVDVEDERIRMVSDNEPIAVFAIYSVDVLKLFDLYTRTTANYNAVRNAIDILGFYKKEKRWPEQTLDYLLDDPFSSEDFEYEYSKTGFVVRCNDEELGVNKLWEFSYKLPLAN